MVRHAVRPLVLLFVLGPPLPVRAAPDAVTRAEVERAIQDGRRYLKEEQRKDGSWHDADTEAHTGTTSLATLALLAAGEPADSPTISRALGFLRGFTPELLKSVYAVSLQTRAFAAIASEQDQIRIARNAQWLEEAQIKPRDRVRAPGSWSYGALKTRNGDNSNTHYALLGLEAAAEAGVPVKPATWALADEYWAGCQHQDGGWGYTLNPGIHATASMTCAGISSLLLLRPNRLANRESLEGEAVRGCGRGIIDPQLHRGIDWLAGHFHVDQNFAINQQWRFYYLDTLECVGQISGERLIGGHDWYREGAERLVHDQDRLEGFWQGAGPIEGGQDHVVTTSFALLFLGRGRAPVLIQKARHGPKNDWMVDPDDARILARTVARDWKRSLNWQIVSLDAATVDDLMRAPILFLNGHKAPELTASGKQALRSYVERGGFVFSEACCGRGEFDRGVRALLKELFPEPESQLHPLAADHPVWRARHALTSDVHPLWGLERGDRTVLIYSPGDLSCGWNLRDRSPNVLATELPLRVGQNVVDFATGRKPPPDKLASFEPGPPASLK